MESDESVTDTSISSTVNDRLDVHDDQADRLPPPTSRAPQLLTWVAAALATVAVGMDIISRAAEEQDVRDWAQWLMIAALAVAILALVSGLGGTAQPARHVAPIVVAVVLFGVAIWMRNHYSDAVGTPVRAIVPGALGVLLLLARNVLMGAVTRSTGDRASLA